jgi:Uncharacterized protein containing a von Willebrand factor type A (vWA) domain
MITSLSLPARRILAAAASSLLACAALTPRLAASPSAADAGRTLSPYFHVRSLDATHDALPLKSTRVEAVVAGVIADVTVTQTYANEGTVPLEALYVFPGSTRAAVHGLTMTVGERRIRAKIRQKEEARATYEAAKSAGQTASLLEQHRPDVFSMAVANILPGDTVEVELRYTELLSPADGVYEFVYPGVVGPRYPNRPAIDALESPRPPASADRWIANPHLQAGEPDPASFALTLRLATGLPVREAASHTHEIDIAYTSPTEARITLDPFERSPSNRDFILRYRLAGEAVQAGLLVSAAPDARGDRYFLAMIQPPARPAPAATPPRDYVFIVDVSGSMHGFPLDTAKHLFRRLLPVLRPTDTFNVLLFSGGSATLSASPLPATPTNLAKALAFLGGRHGGGGTELLPALRHALSIPRPHENTSRIISVITDGYVAVESEAFALIRQNLGRGNVFAFGVGSGVNRHLIESLARAGQGEPFIVTDTVFAETEASRFADMIASPVLTGVSAHFDDVAVRDVEPASLPDVFAQRPVVLFGKWDGDRAGRLRLSGRSGGAGRPFVSELPFAQATTVPAETLSRLWARTRVAALSDELALRKTPELVSAITTLGLEHELLTAYTSFVAVDEVVRRTTPDLETVTQPLPLPEGVSHHAVGNGIGVAPEPGTAGLLLIAGTLAVFALRPRRRVA